MLPSFKVYIYRKTCQDLTDAEYIEILDLAQKNSEEIVKAVSGISTDLKIFLSEMSVALKEWKEGNGTPTERNRSKFHPNYYADRKDEDNPTYLFSLTSTKVLSESIKGDFDLIYLVRLELANLPVS